MTSGGSELLFRRACSVSAWEGRGAAVQSAAAVAPQPEPFLDRQARLPGPGVVVVHRRQSTVLPGKSDHDVDVVNATRRLAVPDGYPSDLGGVITRGKAHLVHELGRDLVPLFIRQQRVFRTGRKHAVPHAVIAAISVNGIQRHVELVDQVPEVPSAVGLQRRRGRGRVTPPGDQVLIAVLVGLPGAEQVVDQSGDPVALADLVDQGSIRCT